jgi:hypothetical protein
MIQPHASHPHAENVLFSSHTSSRAMGQFPTSLSILTNWRVWRQADFYIPILNMIQIEL